MTVAIMANKSKEYVFVRTTKYMIVVYWGNWVNRCPQVKTHAVAVYYLVERGYFGTVLRTKSSRIKIEPQ